MGPSILSGKIPILGGFIAFILCVPAANWLISNVGSYCVPDGPCLIPVFPGIMAPSGILMVGLALVLRDVVHETLGVRWALVGILIGGLFSAIFSPASLVVASTVAFLVSEIGDLAVYAPLRKSGFVRAAVISSIVGLVLDSLIFLTIAFGSLEFLSGQVIGKLWMVMLAVPILAYFRSRLSKPLAS